MATQEEVLLEINARVDKALSGIGQLTKAIEGVNEEAQKVPPKAGTSFLEFAAKIGIAYQAMTKFIGAYQSQAQADARLNTAIKNNTDELSRQGKTISELSDEYKAFATQQQKTTGISDDATQNLQAMLLSFGTAPDQVNRLTAAFQDLSAATGTDVNMMARAWSRMKDAPEEALGALSRAGLKFRKEQLEGLTVDQQRIFILGEMERAFKGNAKAIADASGGLLQAKAAFDDASETAGKLLINVLQPLLIIWNAMPDAMKSVIVTVIALAGAIKVLQTDFFKLSEATKDHPLTRGDMFKNSLKAFAGVGSAILMVSGLLSTLTDETETYKQSVDQVNKLNEQAIASFDKLASQQGMLNALSGLTQGTDAYRQTLNNLLRQNPDLIRMGITNMSSYDDVREAMFQLNAETNRRIALQKIEAMNTQRDILVRKAARFAATEADYAEIDRLTRQIVIETFGGGAAQAAIANFGRTAGRTVQTEVKTGVATGVAAGAKDAAPAAKKAIKEVADTTQEDIGKAISTSFDIGTSIVKGDWKNAIGQTLSSISPILGSVFSSAVGFFSELFGSSSESFTDKLKEQIQNAFNVRAEIEAWSNQIAEAFGENAQISIDIKQSGLEASLKAISETFTQNIFNGITQTLTLVTTDFSKMSVDQVRIIRDALQSLPASGKATNAQMTEWAKKAGISVEQMVSIWSNFRNDTAGVLDQLNAVIELLGQVEDVKIADSLNEYKDQLEEIEHKLNTGEMSQEAANAAQIAIYDQMIASLEGVQGAQETINALEEARYKLLQKEGEQLDTNTQSMKMQALLAEQSALERQIATGAVRAGTYETVSRQQSILQRIISTLRSEGASSSVIAGYEDQLAQLMTTTLGTSGFAALSGSGAAVTLPAYAQSNYGRQASQIVTNNNSSASNNISLNANLPPDIVNYIMREVSRSTGGRNLVGSY